MAHHSSCFPYELQSQGDYQRLEDVEAAIAYPLKLSQGDSQEGEDVKAAMSAEYVPILSQFNAVSDMEESEVDWDWANISNRVKFLLVDEITDRFAIRKRFSLANAERFKLPADQYVALPGPRDTCLYNILFENKQEAISRYHAWDPRVASRDTPPESAACKTALVPSQFFPSLFEEKYSQEGEAVVGEPSANRRL